MRVRVVADTIWEGYPRITTMELEYPRFIHAQMMTHRMFSRNASSSRAIPVARMIEMVEDAQVAPSYWGRNQPGMQAGSELEDIKDAQAIWNEARACAIQHAKWLAAKKAHKQIVNRLLEPFANIRVLVTATEWENFFHLRCHDDAQPEIQELALMMRGAMEGSVPANDVFHAPYVTEHDEQSRLCRLSVARCARVSYLNHDSSSPDPDKDVELHDRLLAAGHLSPFEHVAWPAAGGVPGTTHIDKKGNTWSSNFQKWVQYRQWIAQSR